MAVTEYEAYPIADTGQELIERRRALDMNEAAWLELLSEFDRAGLWSAWGSLSGADWVMGKCRMARSTAYEKLRIADELRRRALVGEAFRSGHLSYSQVRLITRIADPDEGIDETLIALAKKGSVRDLARAIHHYERRREQEKAPGRDRDGERGAYTTHIAPGMQQLRVTLADGEMAEIKAVMEAFLDLSSDQRGVPVDSDLPLISGGGITERRADAFLEIVRAALGACSKRAAGVDRYMANIVIDIETLLSDGPGTAKLIDGTPIDADTARRMACESSVIAHFVRNGFEPLDMGRRVQSFTTAQRRAMKVRDEKTCRFPGCERTNIDCHHISWWTRGGNTDIDNGCCLCPRHHTLVHTPGWKIEGGGNGSLRFLLDGRLMGISLPPGALPSLI